MKILILYRYSPDSSFNHWCNVDFYRDLNKFENVEVRMYGVAIEKLFSDMMILPYRSNITLQDLKYEFNFDIIIVAGRTRTFLNNKEISSWLPKDFHKFNCPKILVEPDYHKYRKLDWFKEFNFDIILHRHKSNVIRADEDFPDFRNLWFPFSVDTTIFTPNPNIEKIKQVCFVGNSKSKSYYYRQKAINKLTTANLLTFEGIQRENQYIITLQNYLGYLNGASLFSIDCAKAFEILASEGVLLTNHAQNGFPELFSNCYVTYENDLSDIEEKTNQLLNDKDLYNYLSKTGRQIILEKHTHEQRCKELLDILKREIKFSANNKESFLEHPKVDVVYNIGNLTEEAWERFKYSYLSISKNNNYNIKISEVGESSNQERIKTFIPEFEYYFHYNSSFDASIAKNNAFRYLIKENLFTFLDVDILVPSDFIERITAFYNRYKKAFICSYIRLKDTTLKDYNDISFQLPLLEIDKKTTSGILVCDKSIYESLNGFDEEYQEWGGRDSDFYERARLIHKLKFFTDCCLFHQYHERNFGTFKEENKNRYTQRLFECSQNKSLITQFKGLIDKSIKTPINTIRLLLSQNINVCLLEQTCYEYITGKELTFPISLGVDNLEKALHLQLLNVKLQKFPYQTKKIKFSNTDIDVPFPVINYLENLYGNKIRQEIKK